MVTIILLCFLDSGKPPAVNQVQTIELNRYCCDENGNNGHWQVIYWSEDFEGRPRVAFYRCLNDKSEFGGGWWDCGAHDWFAVNGQEYFVEAENYLESWSMYDPERDDLRRRNHWNRPGLRPAWHAKQ